MTGCDGRISRVHYVLPRQKAANWVGPGRGRKTTRPGANGVGGHAARRDATGDCCDSCDKLPSHDTSRRQRPNSWLGWARSFLLPPGESSCRSTFDRAIFQGRIDELSVIDIHSL